MSGGQFEPELSGQFNRFAVINFTGFCNLHTAAARQVYELIKYIKKSGNTLIVNWNYEEEDDDMKQLGMDFSSTLGIEFNFSTFIIL